MNYHDNQIALSMDNDANFDFLSLEETTQVHQTVKLEDDLYQCLCVGIVVANRTKYQSTEKEPQVRFVFQVLGTKKLVSTKWAKIENCMYEKSNVAKMLVEWLKVPTVADVQKLLADNQKVNLKIMLNKIATLFLKTKLSATGKEYMTIDSFGPARKGTPLQVTPTMIPKYFAEEEVLQALWIPELTEIEVDVTSEAPF